MWLELREATMDELSKMKVKELRDELSAMGIEMKGYVKKDELIEMLHEARVDKSKAMKKNEAKLKAPKPATSKEATPKAKTPKAKTPKATTPKAATPKAATPKAATPKTATRKTATPKAAEPREEELREATPQKLKPASATEIDAAQPSSSGTKESFAARLASVAVVIAIVAALLAFAGQSGGYGANGKPVEVTKLVIFSKADIASFTGEGEEPIYLALLGGVFDVTKGADHYGPGGGYHFFAGRDSSRAFVTGNFTEHGLVDDVEDLLEKQWRSLIEWKNFYETEYVQVGVLGGEGDEFPFYDGSGAKKQLLLDIEASTKTPLQAQEGEACSSRWDATTGAEVWCDGSGFVPRKIVVRNEGGLEHRKCRCVSAAESSDPESLYPDCDPESTHCKIS